MTVPVPPLTFRDDRDWLEVTGSERLAWLNGLVTCNLAGAVPGDAIYGLLLDKKGKVLADLYALVNPESLMLAVPTSATAVVLAHCEHYIVMEDVEMTKLPLAGAWLHWQSPESAAPSVAAARRVSGLPATVCGDIYPPGAEPPTLGAAAQMAISADLVADARVRFAVPAFAVEFGPTTYPQEAKLEAHAVSFTKGCYLGQEVVCMLELRGKVKRRVQRYRCATSLPVGAQVLDANQGVAGEILRATAHGGFAMVRTAASDASETLTVNGIAITLNDVAPTAIDATNV
jgi:tRNA-modifying protein YgfZ